jgi:DNA-binding CsgD family transcriptional regulator
MSQELYLTGLSQQERICAGFLQAYLTNREIAERMGVSIRSVESIINGMKRKLGCYSKIQLIFVLTGNSHRVIL